MFSLFERALHPTGLPERPEPPGGLPRPGRIRPNLPNNHLQYALTWYGLALVLVVVFGVWVRGRSSEPTGA